MPTSGHHRGLIRNLWVEYCENGTVYAMRHLVLEHRLLVERLYWTLWIGSSIIICMLVIVGMYRKSQENPFVISYATRLAPSASVPFPAVTLCPLAKTRVESINLTKVFYASEISLDKYKKLRALAHICPYLVDWFNVSDPYEDNVFESLYNMSLPMNYVIAACLWRSASIPCQTYMSFSLTDDGICYTFNAIPANELFRNANLHDEYHYSTAWLNSKNWTMESGYVHGAGVNIYPFRPIGMGFSNGLRIVLGTRKIDEEMFCEGPANGFKVVVHAPDELPVMTENFYRVSLGSFLTLLVKPELTTISSSVKRHSYKRRHCYFAGERYLRFFKVYNQNNCIAECVANMTAKECGCVKFSTVHGPEVRVCNAHEIDCYVDAYYNAFDAYLYEQTRVYEWKDPCDCLPACTTLKYDVEITHRPIDFVKAAIAHGYPAEQYDIIDAAAVAVGLKVSHLLPMTRRDITGFGDMLAKFGGLLGFMMGASIVSLLEVIYYFAIRPWRNDVPQRRAFVHQVLPWQP